MNTTTQHIPFHSMAEMIQLVHLLQQDSSKSNVMQPVIDVLMKIAVAICTAGILWLITSVSDLQNQMTTLSVKQNVTEKSMMQLHELSKEPRFTEKDVMQYLAPIKQRIDFQQEMLEGRHKWVSQTNERLGRLENKIEHIIEQR